MLYAIHQWMQKLVGKSKETEYLHVHISLSKYIFTKIKRVILEFKKTLGRHCKIIVTHAMIAWEGYITFVVFFKMNNLSMIMREPEETCMERYIPQNNLSDRFKGKSFMKGKEWLWNFHKLKRLRWHD